MRSKAGLVAPFQTSGLYYETIDLVTNFGTGVNESTPRVGSLESGVWSQRRYSDSRLQTRDLRTFVGFFQMSEEFRKFGRKRRRESHWFLTLWMNEPELLCMQKLSAKLANI